MEKSINVLAVIVLVRVNSEPVDGSVWLAEISEHRVIMESLIKKIMSLFS
jgi:hypothetical protein